jgi:hypothetical protein
MFSNTSQHVQLPSGFPSMAQSCLQIRQSLNGPNIPRPPAALEGKSLAELLADGTVCVEIDSKYPQALGISNLNSV